MADFSWSTAFDAKPLLTCSIGSSPCVSRFNGNGFHLFLFFSLSLNFHYCCTVVAGIDVSLQPPVWCFSSQARWRLKMTKSQSFMVSGGVPPCPGTIWTAWKLMGTRELIWGQAEINWDTWYKSVYWTTNILKIQAYPSMYILAYLFICVVKTAEGRNSRLAH